MYIQQPSFRDHIGRATLGQQGTADLQLMRVRGFASGEIGSLGLKQVAYGLDEINWRCLAQSSCDVPVGADYSRAAQWTHIRSYSEEYRPGESEVG